MKTVEAAIKEAHRAIEAQRPKDVPLGEFLRTVIDSFSLESSTTSEEDAAKARVLARGVLARKELEQAEGGSLSSDQVAELLSLNKRQSVDYQRKERHLVAWRTGTGKWRYPAWQFTKHGILPGIRECLKALDTDNGFGAAIFFLSDRFSLDGQCPLNLLRAGKIDEALTAARRHHHHGAY